MKKLGFTLVEMLAVIFIIGILAVIAVPVINLIIANYKDSAYERQITLLEEEANKWSIANVEYLPDKAEDTIFINLDMLINDGYITNSEILDPRNNKKLNGCITITKDEQYNQYVYKYNDKTCDSLIEGYMPTFTVVGNSQDTIEVNSDFEQFEVSAVSNKGTKLKVTGPTIKKNDQSANEVTTDTVGDKYLLRYKAYDPNYGYTYTKDFNITIVDTQKPVISFASDSGIINNNGTYEIHVEQNDTTFKAPTPTVTDNSCGKTGTDTTVNNCSSTLVVHTRGLYNVSVADDYEYTYYATDSSGNEGAFVLHIIVEDVDAPEIASVTADTTDWVLSGLELTVNATDNVGLASEAYSFDDGATWQASNRKIFNTAGIINIKVRDMSNNISSKTVTIEGKTEYGYEEVSEWTEYAETQPTDEYYLSKTQYRAKTKERVRHYYSTYDFGCRSRPDGYTWADVARVACNQSCNGGYNYEFINYNTGCGGCDRCTHYSNECTNNYTAWGDTNNNQGCGVETRTLYALPVTWGTATGWTTTAPYEQTTSRKPVTRTSIHYVG